MPEGIPTQYVQNMREQGISNTQIIHALQRAEYAPQQISAAMAQADIGPVPIESAQDAGAVSPQTSAWPSSEEQSATPNPEYGSAEAGSAIEGAGFSVEALQQLIEQIIEEKWDALVKDVSRIADWKEKMDGRIATLEQQVSDLKGSFDKLHEAILEKIGEYDVTMREVGTDIKALEAVFKKTLPGFMENVSELSRITDEMKKRK